MFISQAYAAPTQQGYGTLVSMLPLFLVFAVMYFFMIRPNQKKAAEQQRMINAMKRGDKIVMNSGIIGTISKVKDSEFVIEIADDVQITVLKNSVSTLYTTKSDAGSIEKSAKARKDIADSSKKKH
ncbi:MAG: preprotein translocase subunit YajC [Holosporales bacterium]|jgi:preprotein translocase subunit YajC|nr:preprotein translocase subunit YajC [Holosporales bacterium]